MGEAGSSGGMMQPWVILLWDAARLFCRERSSTPFYWKGGCEVHIGTLRSGHETGAEWGLGAQGALEEFSYSPDDSP